MNHIFWESFGTYLGQHERNKKIVKFPQDKKEAEKKSVFIIRKVAIKSTST